MAAASSSTATCCTAAAVQLGARSPASRDALSISSVVAMDGGKKESRVVRYCGSSHGE